MSPVRSMRFVLAGALLAALHASPPQAIAADSAEAIMQRAIVMDSTKRIIVKLRPAPSGVARPMSGEHMNTFMTRAGQPLRWVRRTGTDAHLLELDGSVRLDDAKALAQKLAEDPAVEYAQADRRMYAYARPNDPLYGEQWYLSNAIVGLNLEAAWDITTGANVNPGIVVAVLDTGIVPHADMPANRVLAGYDFISSPLVAGDGNARDPSAKDEGDRITSDIQSGLEDVFDSACPPEPYSSWHGTRVASVIGANTNNTRDIAGVNWNVRILPMRVLGRCGGPVSDILDAMRWAAGLQVGDLPLNTTPAQVLNLSLGVPEPDTAPGQTACGRAEQDVITEILAQPDGVKAIVVAAGNEADDARTSNPGSCNGVVNVAGVLRNGDKAPFSNFGKLVTVSAPYGAAAPEGSRCESSSPETILSLSNSGIDGPLTNGDTLCDNGGTSFSAPLVSGVISLMLSANPNLTPSQVYDILRETARARGFPSGSDCPQIGCGAGTVDAAAAVRAALEGPPASRTFPDLTTVDGGGGGCSLATGQRDASLALLVLGAGACLWLRRRAGRDTQRLRALAGRRA